LDKEKKSINYTLENIGLRKVLELDKEKKSINYTLENIKLRKVLELV